MYYLYPNRSVYLYCLPYHPITNDAEDFRYLSIKKMNSYYNNPYCNFEQGETVLLLYRKSKHLPPGIIGFCHVAGALTKTSDIPREERKYIYDRSMLQLPVHKIRCSIEKNIMDEELLYALPCMNEHRICRVYNECKLIDVPFQLLLSLKDHSEFWYVWNAQRCKQEIKEYKDLFIHLQREQIDFKRYMNLTKGVVKCQYCETKYHEFKPYRPRFFELHETEMFPLNGNKYQKINYRKFVVLCPNCHRKEHEKIIAHKHSGYGRFAIDHLISGWDTKYFKEKFNL